MPLSNIIDLLIQSPRLDTQGYTIDCIHLLFSPEWITLFYPKGPFWVIHQRGSREWSRCYRWGIKRQKGDPVDVYSLTRNAHGKTCRVGRACYWGWQRSYHVIIPFSFSDFSTGFRSSASPALVTRRGLCSDILLGCITAAAWESSSPGFPFHSSLVQCPC